MPKTQWSSLNPLQLGKFAEYYAKMEYISYGYDVYASEVDDHGVDFVAKDRDGRFLEIQVKSTLKTNYAFISADKLALDESRQVCYLRFQDGEFPKVYVIPAVVWLNPPDGGPFVARPYEYGINWSKKNLQVMEQYKAENVL